MAEALWYKDAIIYELHVRSFRDSDGDGVGDFKGLAEKLDYLQDLGVTALWLLPFYPSPLKDDGYDIADYSRINPAYGTLRDFKALLRAAHQRDLKVITELVINHTSDQHAWFQRARRARPGSRWRDFYVWSDTPNRYKDTRIIFKDFESSNWAWDPMARAYYWHRFYSHQPDLNFDSAQVRRAVLRIMNFWLGMGVDGLRLDAIPYLFEREGTTCENLPETHSFLKELRAHFDTKFDNLMLLAEANQWPEDAVAYFGAGDECHMSFHFPLMPRLFMAIRTEDRFPVIDILEQTPEIPDTCQWALFLRNHDELTLEMVTDEERDYMYRVYAYDPQARINLGIRRRLSPLLGNNRRKIELMNGLLFSLPGTPVIYYGDEIGMGDNIYLGDRDGVRTPMQWSADRNAGFSRGNPQRLYLPTIIDPEYHHQAINVEAQANNAHSLLWWMKRIIALRKRLKAFSRGDLKFLHPENRKVLTYTRSFEKQTILVLANLSRFAQYVELDLSEFQGMVPVEVFSRNAFPRIGGLPYLATLGPHAFYWFVLKAERVEDPVKISTRGPELVLTAGIDQLFQGKSKAALEEILADYIAPRRWFGGKARGLRSAQIVEALPVESNAKTAYVTLVKIEYFEGDPETYVLPLTFDSGDKAHHIQHAFPYAVVSDIKVRTRERDEDALLYDALFDKELCKALLDAVAARRRFKGREGDLTIWPTQAFNRVRGGREQNLEPSYSRAEQSNTSVVYGGRLILKIFRRLEEGENPELEIGRFLTEKGFSQSPAVVGGLEYRSRSGQRMILGVLQAYVQNEGDAWRYTLDNLSRYMERALSRLDRFDEYRAPDLPVLDLAEEQVPADVFEILGTYIESARLLGERTAELHLALSSDPENPDFAPEPFTAMTQRSYYQSLRTLVAQNYQVLRRRQRHLPELIATNVQEVLDLRDEATRIFGSLLARKLTAMRIRCHGDYHLGQVLHTGKDFVIIDFEGEPARPFSERRLKRSALRDVAGMLRSFHYAAYSSLFAHQSAGWITSEGFHSLEQWARLWHHWVSVVFLKAYLYRAGSAPFLPESREELRVLLDVHLLEKAIYELGYELNNRPDWVSIPLVGILQLVRQRV